MNTTIRATVMTLVALTCGNARAETGSCEPVKEAITKLNSAAQFQQRGIITYIRTGKSYSLEYLAAGGKEYSRRDDGPWKINTRQPVALVVDNKAAVYECSRTGTELLGSTAAVIYTYRRRTPDHMVREVKAWVA